MAEIIALPQLDRPAALVLDLKQEKYRLRKEGRMRRAFDDAWRAVRAEFPDVDVAREPGAFGALLALVLERLADHPDFRGEIQTVQVA